MLKPTTLELKHHEHLDIKVTQSKQLLPKHTFVGRESQGISRSPRKVNDEEKAKNSKNNLESPYNNYKANEKNGLLDSINTSDPKDLDELLKSKPSNVVDQDLNSMQYQRREQLWRKKNKQKKRLSPSNQSAMVEQSFRLPSIGSKFDMSQKSPQNLSYNVSPDHQSLEVMGVRHKKLPTIDSRGSKYLAEEYPSNP